MLMPDIRDAVRALRATPVVSTVAILSLALGIGANTAIFSIVNALMLRSLPVREPRQLVQLMTGPQRTSWSNPLWEELRDQHAGLFDGAFAYSAPRFNLARGGEAQFVNGMIASGGNKEPAAPSQGTSVSTKFVSPRAWTPTLSSGLFGSVDKRLAGSTRMRPFGIRLTVASS